MPGSVTVSGFGAKGVDLVSSPLKMDDDALRQAQNAETAIVQGFAGLKKRDGFVAHSISTLGSSPIRGGIGLPLPPPGDNGLAPLFVAKSAGGGAGIPVAGLSWVQGTLGSAINGFPRIIWASGLSKFVASGGSSNVTAAYGYSADGLAWTLVAGTTFSRGLVWTGTALVALGSQLSTSCVQTSPDAAVWTTRTAQYNGAGGSWLDLAYSPSLTRLCAVGNSGRVMTSDNDGVTWTSRTPATASSWACVAWSPTLNLFVALSNDSTDVTNVMTSPDGITWTGYAVSFSARQFSRVTWSETLGLFAAVDSSNNWSGNIATSPDGSTWTLRTTPTGRYKSVAVADEIGQFIIMGNSGTGSGPAPGFAVAASPDGVTWTANATPADLDWCDGAYSPTLHRWVVVGQTNLTAGNVMTAEAGSAADPIWIETLDSGATWATTTQLTRKVSTTKHFAVRTQAGATIYLGQTLGQVHRVERAERIPAHDTAVVIGLRHRGRAHPLTRTDRLRLRRDG
jgi:hypothetical protein